MRTLHKTFPETRDSGMSGAFLLMPVNAPVGLGAGRMGPVLTFGVRTG
jgi:hypothetical protein